MVYEIPDQVRDDDRWVRDDEGVGSGYFEAFCSFLRLRSYMIGVPMKMEA